MSTQAADEGAVFEELIASVEGRMMRTIWRVVRHNELSEDTLQDALAVIWRKRNRVRRHPNPEALILKICLNCAYDSLRKLKRLHREGESPRLIDAAGRERNDAPQDLEHKQFVARVHQAIGRLPRNQALAVLMRVIQEQPYDVIATTMGCSETTARIHVSRGRRRLREWLAPLEIRGART